jgi:hypothetical protein
LALLRLTLDFLSEIVFGLVFSRRSGQTLPPIRSPLILESAVTLASKIRQGFGLIVEGKKMMIVSVTNI